MKGAINEWLVTLRQKILILTFNGLFDQAIALSNIGKNELDAWGRIIQSRRFRAGMIFSLSDLVQMCISILKGYTHFFPKEEELNSLQNIENYDHILSFLIFGIKSQLYLQSNQLVESLSEVNSAIDLMNVISIENTEIMYGILLVILSLYSLFEKDVLTRKNSGRSGQRLSTIIRNITRATGGKKSSLERQSMKSLAYSDVLDRNGSFTGNESPLASPRASTTSTKFLDYFKPKEVSISQLVHSNSVLVSKLLAGMPCHFLVQKLHILIRALERRSDPLFVSLPVNFMKEEAKRLSSRKDYKTKYLVIIFLIKSSRMFEKSDESRTIANQICSENKIQTCLSIL
jgi:hypothetical protein